MKDVKRKPSTIRLKIQKYMDRVSGDETKPPQTPDSEPITEESENELVSELRISDKIRTQFEDHLISNLCRKNTKNIITIEKYISCVK